MAISACSFYIKNSCFFLHWERSQKNEEKRARADPFWQRKIRKARRWFCFLCGSSSALKKYVLQHVLFVLLDVQIGCQWMKQVVLGYENFQLYIQLSWTSCTCSGALWEPYPPYGLWWIQVTPKNHQKGSQSYGTRFGSKWVENSSVGAIILIILGPE